MNIKTKGFAFLHLFRNGISATVIFLDNLKISNRKREYKKKKTTNYISCAVSGRSIYTWYLINVSSCCRCPNKRKKNSGCPQRRRDILPQASISIQAHQRPPPPGLCSLVCVCVQVIDSARYRHHISLSLCLPMRFSSFAIYLPLFSALSGHSRRTGTAPGRQHRCLSACRCTGPARGSCVCRNRC